MLACCFLLLSATSVSQARLSSVSSNTSVQTAIDPQQKLARRLDDILRRAKTSRLALVVRDPHEEQSLFARRGQIPLNPASNMKLLTTAAALSRMGPDHRLITEFRGHVEGDWLKGGLYVRGAGDPMITAEDLADVAATLFEQGVRKIDGPLYLDTSLFETKIDPPGFAAFNSVHTFRTGVSALSFNRNAVRIVVEAGAHPGAPATISLDPPSEYLVLKGQVRTTTGRSRLRLISYADNGHTVVSVSGRISLKARQKVFWRRIYHPQHYFAYTLLAALRYQGIEVRNPEIRRGSTPTEVSIIYRHLSPPLGEIVEKTNRFSSNVVAEHLFLLNGLSAFGPPATYEKGKNALDRFLVDLGVRPGSYRLENGSGLSRKSFIRADDIVRVLVHAYRDPEYGQVLFDSLPVAGEEGTLQRRFAHSAARGRVFAKTGTLSGVSCLSGYVEDSGRILAFSLLAGRVNKGRRMSQVQVAVAEALLDYLHAPNADDLSGAPSSVVRSSVVPSSVAPSSVAPSSVAPSAVEGKVPAAATEADSAAASSAPPANEPFEDEIEDTDNQDTDDQENGASSADELLQPPGEY